VSVFTVVYDEGGIVAVEQQPSIGLIGKLKSAKGLKDLADQVKFEDPAKLFIDIATNDEAAIRIGLSERLTDEEKRAATIALAPFVPIVDDIEVVFEPGGLERRREQRIADGAPAPAQGVIIRVLDP